jgi:DNA-binding NarL/FixJ family response regulator
LKENGFNKESTWIIDTSSTSIKIKFMIKIFLADDHKLIRDGVKALLKEEANFIIVGEASNGEQLIKLLAETPTDVVLLDLKMPGLNGTDIIKSIRRNHPTTEVLILSMLSYEFHVKKALEAGAIGYLLKDGGKDELIYALKLAAQGTPYICSNIALGILKKQNNTLTATTLDNPSPSKNNKELTKRELEILYLIGEGHTNIEIADKLFISKRTIETHRQNLLEKTHTKNTASLMKYAFLNGLIS